MLVMVLLGIRFAFTVGRRGALYGIGVSVVIAIAYLVAMHLFEAMGNHGLLPPFLAAWAPNLLFGTAGLYLMSMLETCGGRCAASAGRRAACRPTSRMPIATHLAQWVCQPLDAHEMHVGKQRPSRSARQYR